MTYGLYDADLPYYPTPFYNLELMKISSYYKKKKEIVGLSPSFSPNKYNNFIVRQDFYNPNFISSSMKNIEYGGRAINGNKYVPLPIEIEIMKPDILLYNDLPAPQLKKYKSAFSTMRRAEHVRLSLDGKTIWKDWEKQLRYNNNAYGIIFHDYDLNKTEGAANFIQENLHRWIKNSLGRRIGMKFPVLVSNQEDFYKWLQIKPMGSFYSLHHFGLIDESTIPDLVEINNEYHTLKQVSMDISNTFTPNELINGGFQRLLRNIINLRTQRFVFPLIYNESIFTDNNWKNVMKLIKVYVEHLIGYDNIVYWRKVEPFETLFSYCRNAIRHSYKNEPILTKESLESIFQFVRENDYELFKDFYEYRGGEVRNDR